MKSEIKLRQLLRIIKANPEGFTIDLNGKPIKANKGYMVGITNNKINKDNLRSGVLKLLNSLYLFSNKVYIGGWYDQEKEVYYLDISLHIKPKAEALFLAQTFNQISIYNLKNQECVKSGCKI